MKGLKQNAGGILLCVFELVAGILLLLNPAAFTTGIIIAVGAVLLLMGIISVIGYFRMEAHEAAETQGLLKGLILIAAGAFCVFRSYWFILTFPVLSVIYGVIILIAGLSKIQWTFDMLRMKKKKWFLAAISAALSVVCAILVLNNPFTSSTILWMFTGISLIVEAVFDFVSLIINARKEKTDAKRTEMHPDYIDMEDNKSV